MFRVDDSPLPYRRRREYLVLPNSFWATAEPGSDLLLRQAAFSAWPFTNLFPIRMRKHITGLALKNLANLLQRFKIDS